MKTVVRHMHIAGIALIVAMIFAGCLKPQMPATRYYLLTADIKNPFKDKIPETMQSMQIEIASIRLPQYLERPHIVARSGQNRLEFDEFNQWGGNLRKNMVRVMAENLSTLLTTPNIVISPYRPMKKSDFRIEIEVLHFEKNNEGKVQFSTRWRLAKGMGNGMFVTKVTQLSSEAAVAEKDFEHQVGVMSGLLAQLSRIIAEEIVTYAVERSAR